MSLKGDCTVHFTIPLPGVDTGFWKGGGGGGLCNWSKIWQIRAYARHVFSLFMKFGGPLKGGGGGLTPMTPPPTPARIGPCYDCHQYSIHSSSRGWSLKSFDNLGMLKTMNLFDYKEANVQFYTPKMMPSVNSFKGHSLQRL